VAVVEIPKPIGAVPGFCCDLALWLFFFAGSDAAVAVETGVALESARLRFRLPPGVPVEAALFGSPPEELEGLAFVLIAGGWWSSFSFSFLGGRVGVFFFGTCSSTVASLAGEGARCFFLCETFAGGSRGGGSWIGAGSISISSVSAADFVGSFLACDLITCGGGGGGGRGGATAGADVGAAAVKGAAGLSGDATFKVAESD